MGLLSFFNRTPAAPGATRRSGNTDELTRQARTRARQRLIGALVLVVLGVVVLPLLFDKDPRPLSSKTAVEVVGQGRVAASGQRASGKVIDESAADAGVEVPADKSAASAATPAKAPPKAAPAATASVPEAPREATPPVARKVEPAKAAEADKREQDKREQEKREADKRESQAKAKAAAQESARAKELLAGKEAPAKAAENARFVVQIGAFADGAAASQARGKVEKLGIKTYTQQVETAAGKRIRVRIGPYTDRAEAEKALSRIKAAGLPGAVLTL